LNQEQARVLGGIGFVVLACACFAVLDTTAKYVVLTVPVLMAAWVRYLLQALLSTAVLLPLHGTQVLRTAEPRLQLLRGLLLMSSSLLAFTGLRYMPVGEFTAIVMVTPLAVTLLAATLLREKVAPLHWVFVAGGFLGVLAIVRPGSQALGWGALLAVGCLFTNSVFQLLSSHLGKTEKAATTHLYTSWVGTLALSLVLPIAWTEVESMKTWSLLLLMGVMGALGHFALSLAYSRARAVLLVPYLYVHIGFAVIGGWLVFEQLPGAWSWFGIGLIAVSGICGAWFTARENSTAAQLPES
jgi:drug/metabolite transporter (DMT)-like permease